MSSRRLLPYPIVAFVALLAGCATPVDTAADDTYQPPATGESAAHLRGTKLSEGGMFGDEHLGFVLMVDMKTVPDAAENWSQSLALSPGLHTIVAQDQYSNFKARANLPLEATAGANYQLMIRSGHEPGPDERLYTEFWIVDLATGKPVTVIYHRQATGGKIGTIFNVNK